MSLVNLEYGQKSFSEILFSNAFRPLFLLSALSAILLVASWLLVLKGTITLNSLLFSTTLWHAHEMLFGFVGVSIGGFALTAIANWTQRPPVSGIWLILLSVFWLSGRFSILVSTEIPYQAVLLIDLLFPLLLTVLAGREIILSGNTRNLKVVAILALFGSANLLFHIGILNQDYALSDMAIRLGTMLVAVLIALIGGRITPAFTRNVLMRREPAVENLPVQFNQFDKLISILLGLSAMSWVLFPESFLSGALLCLSGIGQWVRLSRWQPTKILNEPLLWVLHLGFFWLGSGLFLIGLSAMGSIPVSAGYHALGIGAMAGMIVGVASRAALGHTQRPLAAGKLMVSVYLLISLAAVFRVCAAFFLGTGYLHLLISAGVVWCLAFALFAVRYVPILMGPPAKWQRPKS